MSQTKDTRTWKEITGKPARMLKTETGLPFRSSPGGAWADWQKSYRGTNLIPANDNRPCKAPRKLRRNLPVLHAIAKVDPEGAYAVWAYGQQGLPEDVHGDINAGFDGEEEPENPIEFHTESLHKVKPSVEDMLADLCRVRVVSYRAPDRTWSITYRHAGPSTPARHMGEEMIGLGDMRFNYHPKARRPPAGGLMVSYRDRDGNDRQPFYDTSTPRGAAHETISRRPTSAPAIAKLTPDRVVVSEETARILELILAGRRKFEIGLALHYSRDYADRGAQRHIDAAVEEAKVKFPAPPRKEYNMAMAA